MTTAITSLPGPTATERLRELHEAVVDARAATITNSTLHCVIELCALRAYSILEEFLQQLFYDAMLGDQQQVGAQPRFTVRNEPELELLLFNTGSRREKYLDWLPYSASESRAEAYLEDGVPFSRLKYRQVELRAISELATVRNAIAHPSDYAAKKFQELVNHKHYVANVPAEYLLNVRSGDIEMLHTLARLNTIVEGLTAGSDQMANSVLEPENSFEPNKNAPKGEYACTRCDARQVLTTQSMLQPCSNCTVDQRCQTCGRRTSSSPAWIRLF